VQGEVAVIEKSVLVFTASLSEERSSFKPAELKVHCSCNRPSAAHSTAADLLSGFPSAATTSFSF
jgi:hypothetical protein